MLARPNARLFGQDQANAAGYRLLSGRRRSADATAGNITITAAMVAGGYLSRTGPGAGYADATPSADSMLATFPDLTRGDSFDFLLSSGVAFANTITAGAGVTLAGTTAVSASSCREYLITLTSEPKRTRVCVGTTTNASAALSNISIADLSNVGVGMGVSGTNVPASTTIIAVNLTLGTATMSANATGTGDNIALTFTPQFEWRGIRESAN